MSSKQNGFLLLAAIVLISLNLRPPLTVVGPLVQEIRLDTGLSNSMIGFLTTLPILALGIFSILTSLLTRKMGTAGTMAFALLLLTAGSFLRVLPYNPVLFIGTGILGIGIALGNVLLPGIIKERFPGSVGVLTGIYSAILALGAAVASGISVPLSEGTGLGWRFSLGIWGTLSLFTLIVWLPQLKDDKPVVQRQSFLASMKGLIKSPLAWNISIFMGFQSLIFYVLAAWLPEILVERGMGATRAGWLVAAMQAVGMFGSLILPAWAAERKRQHFPILVIIVMEFTALGGIMLSSLDLMLFWVSVLGFATGASFGMALLFIVLRTRTVETANSLSGLAQSVGYTIAATGPVIFGAVYDFSDNWQIPFSLLFVVTVIKLFTGWQSAKNLYIE